MFLTLAANNKNLFAQARHTIVGIIDFFHRPFARFIPTQTFRYLACGGTNTVFNIFIDNIAYNYIFRAHPVHIYGNFIITPEVGALIIALSISIPTGFILSRHIVFPESNLHSRIQFFRYALTTVIFLLMAYFLTKLFAFYLPMINQTVRYTAICVITTIFSYITQRVFTFKIIDEEVLPD